MTTPTLETAAHIVQLALTPIFLLSGVATLLSVFSTRLGRVADQVDKLVFEGEDAHTAERHQRLHILRLRSQFLDLAVVLAALAGALTCGAALVLFLGAVRESGAANMLFLLFGGALLLTMGALAAFVIEMLLASRGVRNLTDRGAASPR
ncbi:DUF2721 domain-containing protein [Caulobacter sp. S45]|uniref:DUF2721 domain-containing protein n=1 Tax=Caulobacter sp. S45 TaxID=1641861 RepID=UPI00131E578F|nr:DUF2721 domain-containing protein [Caulobacter sp. S45]